MTDCLFCKIVAGDIPSEKVYEDDKLLAFHDINPASPVHVLVIPKQHFASLNDFGSEDKDLLGELLFRAKEIAKDLKLDSGFRTVINTGEDGGQTVFHLHVHILGGKKHHWPA